MQFKQRNIIKLLAEMSKVISREKNLPAQSAVREMEEELEFKGKQLANSEITVVRLRSEVDRALETQEGKLRQIQKSVLYLSSFVAGKTAESDFDGTKQAVLDIVEQVNQHLQKQMHTTFAE